MDKPVRKMFSDVTMIEEMPLHPNLSVMVTDDVKRVEKFDKRYYQMTYENFTATVPSVTTILGSKPNPGLDRWRKRVGEIEAARVSHVATTRGQEFHTTIEYYLTNQPYFPVDIPYDVVDLFRKIQPSLNKISKIQMLEKQLWCPTHAGTPDCIAHYDGMASIIDFKTSKGPLYKDSKIKYALQMYAYHKLWEYRYPTWYTTVSSYYVPKQYVIIVGCEDQPEPEVIKIQAKSDKDSSNLMSEMWKEYIDAHKAWEKNQDDV